MTLGTYRSLLYTALKRVAVRDSKGTSVVDMSTGLKVEVAIETLNLGWQYVAALEMGIKRYYQDTLIQGQSEYVIPESMLKVELVRLVEGAILRREMIPAEATGVMGRDSTGEKAQGTPAACAVGLWKFEDSGPAQMCLKFDRPPNWGGDGCIEVYGNGLPQFVSEEDQEPDLPATLGMAGYWQALVQLTGSSQFERRRDEALVAYRRLGIGNQPFGMRSRYR